jgi:cysteine desulfurase
MIYLDYAAATPVRPEVQNILAERNEDDFANPSALYRAGAAQKRRLEAARSLVAQTLSVKPAEIVFTSGATEANNLAIQGVGRRFSDGEMVVGATEHAAVISPAGAVADVVLAPVDHTGRIALDQLGARITERTVLVSIGYVNNEIGTVQPLKRIARTLAAIRAARRAEGNNRPLYFHTDASQAAWLHDIQPNRLGVDLMTLSGGKLYGPKSTGCLYVARSVTLEPLLYGGGQERGLRGGTESVGAAAGLAEALRLAQSERTKYVDQIERLSQEFISALTRDVPTAQVLAGTHHSGHIVALQLPTDDAERLVMALDEAGVQVGTGAACSARSDEPSPVLLAIGLTPRAANQTIRVSFGLSTTVSEVKRAVRVMAGALSV